MLGVMANDAGKFFGVSDLSPLSSISATTNGQIYQKVPILQRGHVQMTSLHLLGDITLHIGSCQRVRESLLCFAKIAVK